ncbi:MAG: hypothetical protein M5U26_04315 [Planctomycetota bacterium]|nr:hypothetical protein [Planctomycetota bacterium]
MPPSDPVTPATTRVFRCRGLCPQLRQEDGLGVHDLLWWVLLLALGGGWYFWAYEPQHQRNEMLEGRLKVLEAQLRAEEFELLRAQREVLALEGNHPDAWERAARAKLGWLLPGEITDQAEWRRAKIEAGEQDPLAALRAAPPARGPRAPATRPAPPHPRTRSMSPEAASRQARREP